MNLTYVRNRVKMITDRPLFIEPFPKIFDRPRQQRQYKEFCDNLPIRGIYFIFDKNNELIHYGDSSSLRDTVRRILAGRTRLRNRRNEFGYLGIVFCSEPALDKLTKEIKLLL
ncbi:hypothetical protein FH832_003098 [Listeria monocytogenes]|nr:hypothetical protein [Listeria monocytogenes]